MAERARELYWEGIAVRILSVRILTTGTYLMAWKGVFLQVRSRRSINLSNQQKTEQLINLTQNDGYLILILIKL